MSRLKPLVGERFKAKSKKYDEITIHSIGNHLYEIIGIKVKGNCEHIESITNKPHSLSMARLAIWDYAEVQDGLPVKMI